MTGGFKVKPHRLDRVSFSNDLQLITDLEPRTGLGDGSVDQPGVSGHDPADRVGGNPLIEQPHDGVKGGLTRTNDDIAVGIHA